MNNGADAGKYVYEEEAWKLDSAKRKDSASRDTVDGELCYACVDIGTGLSISSCRGIERGK